MFGETENEWSTKDLLVDIKYGDAKDNMSDVHFHNQYEIYYIFQGSRLFFIQEKMYILNEGDMLFVKPNVIHQSCAVKKHTSKRGVIQFKPGFMSHLLNEKSEILNFFEKYTTISLDQKQREVIEVLLVSLNNEYVGKKKYRKDIIYAILFQILAEISRIENDKVLEEVPEYSDSPVFDIVKYINNNFSKKLTLDVLSTEFYMSKYYISHIFKREMGISFQEYLNKVRIAEAVKLFDNSSFSIMKVSKMTGFSSSNYFCKVFKRIVGITPTKYKMNL